MVQRVTRKVPTPELPPVRLNISGAMNSAIAATDQGNQALFGTISDIAYDAAKTEAIERGMKEAAEYDLQRNEDGTLAPVDRQDNYRFAGETFNKMVGTRWAIQAMNDATVWLANERLRNPEDPVAFANAANEYRKTTLKNAPVEAIELYERNFGTALAREMNGINSTINENEIKATKGRLAQLLDVYAQDIVVGHKTGVDVEKATDFYIKTVEQARRDGILSDLDVQNTYTDLRRRVATGNLTSEMIDNSGNVIVGPARIREVLSALEAGNVDHPALKSIGVKLQPMDGEPVGKELRQRLTIAMRNYGESDTLAANVATVTRYMNYTQQSKLGGTGDDPIIPAAYAEAPVPTKAMQKAAEVVIQRHHNRPLNYMDPNDFPDIVAAQKETGLWGERLGQFFDQVVRGANFGSPQANAAALRNGLDLYARLTSGESAAIGLMNAEVALGSKAAQVLSVAKERMIAGGEDAAEAIRAARAQVLNKEPSEKQKARDILGSDYNKIRDKAFAEHASSVMGETPGFFWNAIHKIFTLGEDAKSTAAAPYRVRQMLNKHFDQYVAAGRTADDAAKMAMQRVNEVASESYAGIEMDQFANPGDRRLVTDAPDKIFRMDGKENWALVHKFSGYGKDYAITSNANRPWFVQFVEAQVSDLLAKNNAMPDSWKPQMGKNLFVMATGDKVTKQVGGQEMRFPRYNIVADFGNGLTILPGFDGDYSDAFIAEKMKRAKARASELGDEIEKDAKMWKSIENGWRDIGIKQRRIRASGSPDDGDEGEVADFSATKKISPESPRALPTLILSDGVSGRAAVNVAVAEVDRVFGGGEFLRRIAKAETNYGETYGTFRMQDKGGSFGIFQTDRNTGFAATKDLKSHPTLARKHELIKQEFGIDWMKVEYKDLAKPLYSALAARLFLSTIPAPIPPSSDLEGQANYWKQYYNTAAGRGTARRFMQVNENE